MYLAKRGGNFPYLSLLAVTLIGKWVLSLMTMILTCITKDFIVQASDRRLSAATGKTVQVVEDHSNKALIYSNHFVFAYTGLVKLHSGFPSAIDWAAQKLSEKENLGDAVLHLGNSASDLMRTSYIQNMYSRSPAYVKRLAFVGAGFADVNDAWQRWPLRIVISNFRREDGNWLLQPHEVFRVDFDLLPERSTFELFVAGQQLSIERKEKLTKLLAWCFRHKKGPETIGRLLTREIQAVAEKTVTVGKNIMCTFAPRAFGSNIRYHFGSMLVENPVISAEPQHLGLAKIVSIHDRFAIPPPFDDPRFVYVAGDNQALPYYGPILVVPGSPGSVLQMEMSDGSLTVPPVSRASSPQSG
jgi:hypothetical protein